MSIRPKYGKSCCEEAQLTADHLATMTAERNSLQRCLDSWRVSAEKAEAERDEARGSRDYWIDLYGELRDELQAKLDAAENRPTLDREAVQRIIEDSWEENGRGELEVFHETKAVDAIMALVPSDEGWPEWMGPKVDPDDFEVTRDSLGKIRVDGTFFGIEGSAKDMSDKVTAFVHDAALFGAVARFIESEQAATGDEDQRVEEQAKALFRTFHPLSNWEENVHTHGQFRAVIRAGWTPPENEAE